MKTKLDAADDFERKRKQLASSAEARASAVLKANAAYESAQAALETAKTTADQVRDTANRSVKQFGDADLILAQAIAEAVKDGEKTDAELIAELPAVVDDLSQADIGFRMGEFGSRGGVTLETYAAVRDNPGHWINRLRRDGKFVPIFARSGERWQSVAGGYIETEIARRSVKSPTDLGINENEVNHRLRRIADERAEAVAYEEAN